MKYKKPFLHAFAGAGYIALLVSLMNFVVSSGRKDNIVIPMMMLSLFVLSATIMGFIFLYEPIRLYVEGAKKEAVVFFGQIVGFFAIFTLIFIALFFLV